jgi:hypothetical protein
MLLRSESPQRFIVGLLVVVALLGLKAGGQDVSWPPDFASAFVQGPFGSGRAWIFTGTPAKHRMTIYCSVLYERGGSSEVIAAKSRRAGAVFSGMLERLSVERR